MFPGETWKVPFSQTDSAKRRVAFSGRIEEKKSDEQCSGAAAVATGRAAASVETMSEVLMVEV